MNTSTALLLLGGILSLIAIVGGGFEIRELKIPKVDRLPRAIAGISGILLIWIGIGITEITFNDPPDVQQQVGMVTFTVKTQLSEGQVSEQSRIMIDGRAVGDLTINSHFPQAMLTISVPSAGRYSYTVSSNLVFDTNGKLEDYVGAGQGIIDVQPGKIFEMQAAVSGNGLVIAIAE